MMRDPGISSTAGGVRDGEAPAVVFTDGSPGFGPCFSCGQTDELRLGCCFDCAMDGEERAARRTVLQHLGHGVWSVLRGRFGFGTRMDFVWAWERLTKSGDYAPGGEFDRQYFAPAPPSRPISPPSAADTSDRQRNPGTPPETLTAKEPK